LLAKVGRLDLLRAGVPEVVVPDAVVREVRAHGPADPVFQEVGRATWLTIEPTPPTPASVLAWGLGAGESSVLAVALADEDCEVVLDDRDARRCAQALGIGCRGTLGIVLLARKLGLLPSARPVVEDLRRVGLYLTNDLADQALALVGE
jgi:predicted nucleic acid-binding protein